MITYSSFFWYLAWMIVGIWIFGARKKHFGDGFYGFRYQLLRSLRAMNKGDSAIMEAVMPNSSEFFSSDELRNEWFKSLQNNDIWLKNDIRCVLLPSTWHASSIGGFLLKDDLIEPSHLHWVPNLRFYRISSKGRDLLTEMNIWWGSLSYFERLKIMFTE